MSRKILFINPPIINVDNKDQMDFVMKRQSIENIPYGILSICSYLKKYAKTSVDIRVVDLNADIYKAYLDNVVDMQRHIDDILYEIITEYKPDIVGISIMFTISYSYLLPISRKVKEICSDIMVVVGGNLATSAYGEVLAIDEVSAVAYGEGEIPVLQLMESRDIRKEIQDNPAFITKEKFAAGKLPCSVMVENLDSLPPIDFSYIQIDCYEKPKIRFFQKDVGSAWHDPVTLVIFTSRGCPFSCCFCACHVMHGKKVRYMSVAKVLSDVRLMVDNYGIECIFINDDNFLLDKARAKKILNEFLLMGIKVNFPSIFIKNIDEEIACLLSRLGVTTQLVSIESGSNYVLKNIIKKPLLIEDVKVAVENLRKHGISCDTNVIIGFPGETDEHRKETIEVVSTLGFNWVYYYIVLPVPGTSLYKLCEENNYIVDKCFFSPNFSKCNIKTDEYTPEQIEWQMYMMNLHSNFINNYNLRSGNYDKCISQFSNITKLYTDHAFAYYALMLAYIGKGDADLAEVNKRKFQEIIDRSQYWKDWAGYFHLI